MLSHTTVQGRYQDANLILVTHGLTLRIFLMRWCVCSQPMMYGMHSTATPLLSRTRQYVSR
jgi:broad specificity phosphatase PhoE